MGARSGLLTHRGDGQRFIVPADEKLTAFVALEAETRACGELRRTAETSFGNCRRRRYDKSNEHYLRDDRAVRLGDENDTSIILHRSCIALRHRFAYSAGGLPARLLNQQQHCAR